MFQHVPHVSPRMRIRKQLMWSYLLVAALLVLIGLVGMVASLRMRSEVDLAIRGTAPAVMA